MVLFEGVRDETAGPAPDPAAREKAIERSSYYKLATSLNLTDQSSGLDYRRKHFVRCDMSFQQMIAILEQEKAAGGRQGHDAGIALKELSKVGNTLRSGTMLTKFALWMVRSSDTMKAAIRLDMIKTLGSEPQGVSEGFSPRCAKLILDDRNDYALKEMDRIIADQRPTGKVIVFYGAAHLPGMEAGLRHRGYRPAGPIQWSDAITVHPAAEGIRQ